MKKRIFSILLMLLVAFTLVACKKDPKPDEDPIKQKFDEVVETLNGLVSKPDEVKNDLTLPKTFRHGITGEWKSSDDKLLALTVGDTTVAGKVSRPDHDEGNKKVTLSIELVLVEDDKEHTRNWSLELTIIALDPPASTETYTSFKDAYEALIDGEFKLDNFRTGTLEFEGVKLYGTTSAGQYVATSDGTIAYIHGSTPKFEAGKTYNATAKLYDYFGFIQLDGVNISESDEDIEVDVNFAEKSIAEIVKLPLPNVDGHRVYPETWVLKDVKFLIDKTMSSESYNLVIVDKDFDPETAERSEDGDNYYKDSVMAYYVVHDYNQLKALEGTVISELEVIYEGYRDDKHVHYVTVLSIDDHVHLELTDELKVDMAKAALEIDTNFAKDTTTVFPTTGVQETEISWSFKKVDDVNNKLVNFDTGEISIPEEGRVTVTVVATISFGTKSVTKEFEITIGEYILETIENALALEKGKKIMVKGVVTDKFANNTYGIQDETGSIALYTREDLTLGRLYTIVGEKDTYNELPQLKDLEIENVATATAQTPFAIDDILDDNDELEKHIAKLVSINGLEVLEVDTSNEDGNITVTVKKNNVELEIRYDSRVSGVDEDALKNLTVGDTINYIGNLGWYNGPKLGYGPNTFVGEGQPEAQPLPTIEGAVTIAKFLEESEEDADYEGIIVAVITSLAPQSSFSMEDATGAIQFRKSGISAASADFAVGDVVIVTAKRNTYNGLIQAEVQGEYEVRTGNFVRQPFVDLDEETVSNNFLIENQSKIVKATDVEVVSVSVDDYGTVTTKVKFGTEEVDIIYDNRIPGFNPDFLLSLQVGDKVNIDGATITVNNTARLMMSDPMQVFNDKTEDYLAFSAEINNFEFNENTLTENTTLTLPATLNSDIEVEWTAVEGGTHINLTTGLVTIPDATATLILKAVFTKGDLTTEKEFEFTLFIQEELDHVVKFDFTQLEGAKGTQLTTENLVEVFNSVSDNPLALTGVADLDRIYQGNGSGGGEYANVEGVLKTGANKTNGTMTLTFSEEITKVTLVVRGWGSTDTLTINGVKVTLPSAKGTITIDLTEGATVLNFLFEDRALIEEITFE